jgi:hypothetical protein
VLEQVPGEEREQQAAYQAHQVHQIFKSCDVPHLTNMHTQAQFVIESGYVLGKKHYYHHMRRTAHKEWRSDRGKIKLQQEYLEWLQQGFLQIIDSSHSLHTH